MGDSAITDNIVSACGQMAGSVCGHLDDSEQPAGNHG